MVEHFTFADSVTGLTLALETALSLRRFGFRTRLATRDFGHRFTVHTVVATPPRRPNRADRGCNVQAH